jgi:hypothetical protein
VYHFAQSHSNWNLSLHAARYKEHTLDCGDAAEVVTHVAKLQFVGVIWVSCCTRSQPVSCAKLELLAILKVELATNLALLRLGSVGTGR